MFLTEELKQLLIFFQMTKINSHQAPKPDSSQAINYDKIASKTGTK